MPVEAPPAPPASNLDSAFTALDALVEPSSVEPTPPKAPEPPPEPPKTAQEPPKEVPGDKVPPKEEKPPTAPPKPEKAKTLAEAKERAQAEAKQWREKFEALEKSSKTKPQEADLKPYEEKIANLEKERGELLEKLRFKDYEQHPEYQDRYEKPFLNAYSEGRKFVEQLEVVERKNDLDQVVQPGRKATTADFDAVARLYAFNPSEGSKLANQLFGEMAPDVKAHVREAQRLFNVKEQAKADFRTKGSEAEKLQAETQQRQMKAESDAFNQALEYGPKQWPDRFAPKDGDDKGNALLERSRDNAVRAFSDGRPLKEGQKPLSGLELAQLRGAIVNQAAQYPRERMWRLAAEAALAEANRKLEKFTASEPTGETTKKEGSAKAPVSFESVLDGLDKYVTT